MTLSPHFPKIWPLQQQHNEHLELGWMVRIGGLHIVRVAIKKAFHDLPMRAPTGQARSPLITMYWTIELAMARARETRFDEWWLQMVFCLTAFRPRKAHVHICSAVCLAGFTWTINNLTSREETEWLRLHRFNLQTIQWLVILIVAHAVLLELALC